jgi:arylsulfatase A-like enzyme
MSTCPLSSPYRGMFLSGMYPERNGVMSNCMADRPTSTLDTNAVCISDVFNANGYSCGYIGKLHAEAPTRNDPDNPGHYVSSRRPEWDAYTPKSHRHGFTYWYSYGTFDEHKNPHYWDNDGHKHEPKEFSVKHETDKAIGFLRNDEGQRDPGKPFFLCVAYNPPHSPYGSLNDCMEEDYSLYSGKSLGELYVRANADTTMKKSSSLRYYLANVTAVDREFGRLMDALKETGLDRNTIVVFTSDHGETMCSHHTEDPKNSIWTESFNVPFIIRYPGVLQHRIDSVFLTSTDIMPTLLSLCGMSKRIPSSVEGKDLSGILLGKSSRRPEAALYMRNLDGEEDC